MKLLLALSLLLNSMLTFSKCEGEKVYYLNGKKLQFLSEPEYERKEKYVNRLDYYQIDHKSKRFIITKDGVLKYDTIKVKLTKQVMSYFYFAIKDGKILLEMIDSDGIDMLMTRLVIIDLLSGKIESTWKTPCGHYRTYYTKIKSDLIYLCEYTCSKKYKEVKNKIFKYIGAKWVSIEDEKTCKEFGKHKEIEFIKSKRILIKDKFDKRYTTEWLKPDKVECILPIK